MIFITVKFNVKPEWVERWPELTADFTAATRAEPGNLWFDCCRASLTPPQAWWHWPWSGTGSPVPPRQPCFPA